MKTKKHLVHAILLICCAATLLLSGCLNLAKKQVPRNYFVLHAAGTSLNAALTPDGPSLIIRNVSISPLFAGKEFVYRLTDDQYQSDYYNLFFTTPGNMLREVAATSLSDSTAYNLIHGTATSITPSYDLELYVTELYGDFRISEKPVAQFSMLAYLIHDTGDTPTIVLSKNYSASVPMPKRTPQDLSAAWEKGLQEILGQLDNDVIAAIAPPTT